MNKDIEVPEIGESVSSGILAAWLKGDGTKIDEGDEIFELETDKATLAVPSPASGVLHHGAAEGDEVDVGQVVGRVDSEAEAPAAEETAEGDTGEAEAEEPAAAERETQEEPGGQRKQPETAKKPAAGPAEHEDAPAAGAGAKTEALSPAVRRIVAEHDLDPAAIAGTGPGGRITKEDAEKAARAGKPSAEPSPAPSADGGKGRPAGAARPAPAALGEPSMPTNERQRRLPLSTLRRRIAENLVYSRQSSAHVTTFNEVDMSAIMEVRAKHRDTFQDRHGVRLGFMSFFVKASQTALQAFPTVNAYLDGTDILLNDYVNIGVALSIEKGLLTPVIKDVGIRSFADIEQQIVDFSKRAGEKRLKPDEMVGATFTISNGGIFGSLLSTPIPSPPQTAVLGMHAIQKRPVAIGDEIVIRPMMYLALTYDHRMIDGREAVLFLGRIKELVEDPARLLLGI